MQIIADRRIHYTIKSNPIASKKLEELKKYYDMGAISATEYVASKQQVLFEAKIIQKVSKK